MPHELQPLDYESVNRSPGSRSWDAGTGVVEWPVPSSPSGSGLPSASPIDVARPPYTEVPPVKPEAWILKRGHSLSFAGLFLFTVVLYFRPYELIAALASFRSIAFWIAIATLAVFIPTQLGMEGTLTVRPREVNSALLFSLAGLLSFPLAINPGEAWQGFVELAKVVTMFIVMINVVRTERRLKTLMFLSVGVGCVLAEGTIRDYLIGNLKSNGERISGVIGGMFENPNDLALHLVMMIPIAAALGFATRSLLKKALYGASFLLMVAGVIFTFSRGGFLGLVVAMTVFAWKLGRNNRLLVVASIVVMVVVLVLVMPGAMAERFVSIVRPLSDESAGGSVISRSQLFWRSIQVTLRHPLLGIGMNNFHIVSIHEQVSHNAYTQVSAEMGIPALIAYLSLIVAPLKRLRRAEHQMAGTKPSRFYYLAIGLQASLVGFMVSSFFGSVAYLYYLYYVAGYAFCLYRIYESSVANENRAATPSRPIALAGGLPEFGT